MSIASRQVTKEVNRIVEEKMKDGYIPTVEDILASLGRFYSRVKVGSPSFMNRKQKYRKVWSTEAYNSNISEIYDDLNNLYEEMVDQFVVVLEDFDYAETERRKSYHQIQSLYDELQNLLLISADTAGFLYSAYDNFIDTSKVNMQYSTCEINTDSQLCTLRESRDGIKKIDLSHYYDVVNYPILADSAYVSNIVTNAVFPTSTFGSAFMDGNGSWLQNIITSKPGKMVLSFVIDLTPNNADGEYVSRIEMTGQSPHPMSVEPLWSLDNINFQTFPMGYATNLKDVGDGKKTVWNFSRVRIRYIKFMVTKQMEDEAITNNGSPAYRYVVGFKNINVYKMAYAGSSVLYSNAFTVTDSTGEPMTIDKASIVVDQDVQEKTSIRYSLSLGASGVYDPTLFDWTIVSPTNDPIGTDQRVADFKHVAFFANVPEIQWDSSRYGTPIETANGINFYTVYEFPYAPLRDSVTLYRGKNNWQVNPRYRVTRVAIYDEEHKFGSGDTITLNHPDFTPYAGQGLVRATVRVQNEPGSNPSYVYVNNSDYIVSYTTNTITKPTGSKITSDSSSPQNTVYVSYSYDQETALPTIYTAYLYITNQNGLDIYHKPWISSEITDNNFTTIQSGGITTDISTKSFYHLPPGWNKVDTTGQPNTIYDRFYSANGNVYLYDKVTAQYAFATEIQETSWFELRYNTLITDHTKYCITDFYGNGTKMLVVNYRPQTSAWSLGADLLCPNGAETYVISYKYISTLTNTIYLRAELGRDASADELTTPSLHSYTIKIGY